MKSLNPTSPNFKSGCASHTALMLTASSRADLTLTNFAISITSFPGARSMANQDPIRATLFSSGYLKESSCKANETTARLSFGYLSRKPAEGIQTTTAWIETRRRGSKIFSADWKLHGVDWNPTGVDRNSTTRIEQS